MNVEIADKLVKLRKEKGYSQESLADALGISRQAVSKWERAEASPDTDNLIELAKLYGVSLDELLGTGNGSDKKEEKEETSAKENKEKDDYVHIGNDGIHVIEKDGDEVHIDGDGIRIVEDGVEKTIKDKWSENHGILRSVVWSVSFLLATIGYILLGTLCGFWTWGWLLFLLAIVISSFVEAITKKRASHFCYPVLVVMVYVFCGLALTDLFNIPNIWHPTWVLFITVPVYYIVTDAIRKAIRHKKGLPLNGDDEDDD